MVDIDGCCESLKTKFLGIVLERNKALFYTFACFIIRCFFTLRHKIVIIQIFLIYKQPFTIHRTSLENSKNHFINIFSFPHNAPSFVPVFSSCPYIRLPLSVYGSKVQCFSCFPPMSYAMGINLFLYFTFCLPLKAQEDHLFQQVLEIGQNLFHFGYVLLKSGDVYDLPQSF